MSYLDKVSVGGTTYDVQDSKAQAVFAAEYDSTASYTAGQYAMHEGTLYRATANTTGTWTAADWTAVTVGGEMTADKAALAAETTARAAEDADIYMEPWQLMMKKYCATTTQLNGVTVRRNHITFSPTSSASVSRILCVSGSEITLATGSLGDYEATTGKLIPVSVFGDKLKLEFCVNITGDVGNRIPRFGYKWFTVDGETITAGSNGTVPSNAVAGQICDGTVDIPEGVTHVFLCLLFTKGFSSNGTYDMVYKADKG